MLASTTAIRAASQLSLGTPLLSWEAAEAQLRTITKVAVAWQWWLWAVDSLLLRMREMQKLHKAQEHNKPFPCPVPRAGETQVPKL